MSDADIRFIYRCDACGRFWAVGFGCGVALRCDGCGSKERTHTATVAPGTALVALLNAPAAERARLLADLKGEGGDR